MSTIARIAALAALLALAAAAPARAEFGIVPGSFTATVSTTQAGGHPDATVDFRLNAHGNVPDDSAKTFVVGLPPGLSGNPNAVPTCTAGAMGANQCPPESQVGVATLTLGTTPTGFPFTTAVYNLVPSHGHTAEFGFLVLVANVLIVVRVRDEDDYGLTTTISNVSSLLPLLGSSLTFWGVPADASHDKQRGRCATNPSPTCSIPSGAPRKPFMTNPTECGVEGAATLTADSWQDPGRFVPTLHSAPTAMTGCDELEFEPSIAVAPEEPRADAPSGLSVSLRVPQSDDPDGLATPTLQEAVVTLPEGVSLSPAAADGLAACSDAQRDAPGCPEASIVGDVAIDTPLLTEPLRGPIYLGTPTADSPFRVFLDAAGSGVRVRLDGIVDADPDTGQLTTTFEDNPPLPFDEFRLRFKGGPRAVLAMPATCGTKTASAELTALSGHVAEASSSFEITGCDGGFSPGFAAGTADPRAGAFAPFSLQVTRSDGQQELARLASVHLPPGLVADVGSVPQCADAEVAGHACPDASQVGTVTIGAGPGSRPFFLGGKAYLTGPYRGAPFGLVFVVQALAGPFDLGFVVVRSAIAVHDDGSLTVVSDPFPTILQGIPLRLRDVRVHLDRPRFMLNPTSCDPMSIGASAASAQGASATMSARFQVEGCSALRFAPSVNAETSGGANSKNGASLKFHVGMRPGQANLRSVRVTLPKAIGPRLQTINKACPIGEFQRGACPPASRVGTARAVTSLLRRPLGGPVHLVVVPGQLPTLRVQLRGEVAIDLAGAIDIAHGATTTFGAIPDLPIESFDLDLPQGPSSLLTPSGRLCEQRIRMTGRLTGQNGRALERSIPVAVRDCRISIAGARLQAGRLALSVVAPGAGRLTVTGRGVRRTRATARARGLRTLTVPLAGPARRTLARGKRLRIRVKVAYRASRGAGAPSGSASRRVTLTARRPPTAASRPRASRPPSASRPGGRR